MPIDTPVSDTSRATQHDRDESWPALVELTVTWDTKHGLMRRTEVISADQFYGHGIHGAPLDGSYLIMAIERMRRAGPPKPPKLKRPPRKASR